MLDLHQLPTQRCMFGQLSTQILLILLAGSHFFGRRYQQHIALKAFVEILAFKHQVQCLIPGDVLQIEGHTALHGITDHQIEPGKICQQLQHRAHFDALEVKGYGFAHIDRPGRF